MKIKGKLFGIGTGLIFGGIPGAVIGGVLGHLFDSFKTTEESDLVGEMKELIYWIVKVCEFDDRFMFSKREYLRGNIINRMGIDEETKRMLMKEFDTTLNNQNRKIISLLTGSFGDKKLLYFKEIYNITSIGGLTEGKSKYLRKIADKLKLSEKDFKSVDDDFKSKIESYNQGIKHAMDILRLPINFSVEDINRQYNMLKSDFGAIDDDFYRMRFDELNEAFVKLNNDFKEA